MEIKFKSTPGNFEKEMLGRKRNTVRVIEEEDERGNILRKIAAEGNARNMFVVVENTETKEKFKRMITDVTLFGLNNTLEVFIISW